MNTITNKPIINCMDICERIDELSQAQDRFVQRQMSKTEEKWKTKNGDPDPVVGIRRLERSVNMRATEAATFWVANNGQELRNLKTFAGHISRYKAWFAGEPVIRKDYFEHAAPEMMDDVEEADLKRLYDTLKCCGVEYVIRNNRK